MRRFFPTIGVLLMTLLATSAAQAQDPLTLRIEPGVAVPLAAPQADRFDVGGELTLKPMIGITPIVDLGLSTTVLVLPSDVSGVDAGTAWGVGGGVRLKRPRDASNKDTGARAVSPWVDADLQYVRTGDLNRAGLMFGAGAAFPVVDDRSLWAGPFIRYQDIFQGDRVGYDSTNAHVGIIGVSIEVGPRTKKVSECGDACGDRDRDGVLNGVDRCPDVPGPASNLGCPLPEPKAEKPAPSPLPPVVPPVVEIRQRVQFDFDSAAINKDAEQALAQVLQVLQQNPSWHVEIRGHASSDGPLAHNKKLAQRRAESVLTFLKTRGVAGSRMTAKGLGVTEPAAPNATEAGRTVNRRVDFSVDFVITKNGGTK